MHVLISALHRPTKPTGVCRHAVNLAQCLAGKSCITNVTLVIGYWQQSYFNSAFDLNNKKITIVPVDIRNSSWFRNFWFIRGLPKLAKALKPDIIHLSFPFPFIRKWFSVPVVSTIHDLYPYEYPQNFGYPRVLFNQAFLRQCIRNSDGLICVSKETLKTLGTYFSRSRQQKKTSVIYNVVDFSSIKSKSPDELNVVSSSHTTHSFLMTVAQHRKNKNLDLLIKAYAILHDDSKLATSTKLIIVGSSGPETEVLANLATDLAINEQVLFLSGVKDEELRWLYERALLFVIPSSTEGFCIPLAEALALGCSAVCSDIPIFREVGADQCRYFDLSKKESQVLAEAIITELDTPTSLQKTSGDQRFSRQCVAQQLVDFYAQVVPGNFKQYNYNKICKTS